MNIEIANRLVNLRKENNLSQEGLAEKLGISRQAVSKWERAEASPDTDNLILLAKLYGVSIDSLLQSDGIPIIEIEEKENKEDFNTENDNIYFNQKDKNGKKEYVNIGLNGIHVREKNGSEVHIGWDGIHVKEEDGSVVHVGWKVNDTEKEEYKCDYNWCQNQNDREKDKQSHNYRKEDFEGEDSTREDSKKDNDRSSEYKSGEDSTNKESKSKESYSRKWIHITEIKNTDKLYDNINKIQKSIEDICENIYSEFKGLK